MSTALIWQTDSTGFDTTVEIAARVGSRLRGGEVIELISDLGGGKTTFVRGLAAGMGSRDSVSSPSFTLSNQYRAADMTLYHFDFYRLQEPGIMRDELIEILADPTAVVIVEWANIVEPVLPVIRVTINISATGDNSRRLEFAYPPELSYLFPNT